MRLLILLLILSFPLHAEQLTPRDYAIAGQIETGVPAIITLAVAAHESGGDLAHKPIRCFDGSLDYGAGFNSRWLSWYAWKFNHGKPIPTASAESLLVVARALKWNRDTFGDWPRALTAYRRGQTWTKRNGIDAHYVDKIIEEMGDGRATVLLR